MFFGRLLGRLAQRNGRAASLEAAATGIHRADLSTPRLDEPVPTGRRERPIGDGEDVLADTISAKVLHGWLQNRQQTQYPLTLNFRALATEGQATLARWLAIALLAGRSPRAPRDEAERGRVWLSSVGAGADAVAEFERAFADPPALSRTLDSAVGQDLAAYAYVIGVIASDPRSPASLRFLDYLEARLELPTALVRSAARKYYR